MRSPFMTRRRFLRDLGVSGVAAPLLVGFESLFEKKLGYAQALPKRRFICVYTPNGKRNQDWRIPIAGAQLDLTTGPANAALGAATCSLSPLQPNASKILILDRISYVAARKHFNGIADGLGPVSSIDGIQHPGGHQKGMAAILTGQVLIGGAQNNGDAGLGSAISLDQVLAATPYGKGLKFPSLQVGVNVDENLADRYVDKRLSYTGSRMPLPPVVDPFVLFNQIFSGVSSSGGPQMSNIRQLMDKSVLDTVQQDFTRLQTKLSQADWQLLQQHQAGIRAIEQQLTTVFQTSVGCTVPPAPATTVGAGGPDPMSAVATHAWAQDVKNFQVVGSLMMDIVVQALACGLTNLVTFQWANSEWDKVMSWIPGVTGGHHGLSHAQDPQLLKIDTWYSSQVNAMINKMSAVQDSGTAGTLLDNSLLMYTSCMSDGQAHVSTNAPILLAGTNGGYFKSGKALRFNNTFTPNALADQQSIGTPDVSNNDLLASILDSFGQLSAMPASMKDPRFYSGSPLHYVKPSEGAPF
jgi:Protein of unknown function (DUF1552)